MARKDDLNVINAIVGIGKHIAKINWPCMSPGCNHTAINSHLLQRHGMLSHIVENGHCCELRSKDFYNWSPDSPPIEFKLRGLQEAISMPLFCDYHDTVLFKPIEAREVDYSNYHNQLLLSYRATCAEIRKKEIEMEKSKRYLSSIILQTHRSEYLDVVKESMAGNDVGLRDLYYFKDQIEKELNDSHRVFSFVHHSYPIKGIYASTTFSLASVYEYANLDLVLPDCFGHVIPAEDHTEFVFGYHKNHVNSTVINFVNGWGGLSIEDLGKKLTGWLTLVESWGLSPSLYRRIRKRDLDTYFSYFEKSYIIIDQNPDLDFNMFSGLL